MRVKVTCANPIKLYGEIIDYGISVEQLRVVDEISCLLDVPGNMTEKLSDVILKSGGEYQIVSGGASNLMFARVCHRPFLVIGIFFFILALLLLPNRVLFITVDGNEFVSSEEILTAAENAGIYFGTLRSAIRSEKVKNILLDCIPQLQWVGVNTKGCVATISVKEKTTAVVPDEFCGASSVVAIRDGVISQMIVHRGNQLCNVGQTVREGQVLVSAYTDCGFSIRAEKASAEIYADTVRGISMKIPMESTVRGNLIREKKKYSLIFGKKRINFFKETGIYDTSCVKMYEQYFLTLPGGFSLPISFIKETVCFYEVHASEGDQYADFTWCYDFAEQYLMDQMVAGEILDRNIKQRPISENPFYIAEYACRELIGTNRIEEIIIANE